MHNQITTVYLQSFALSFKQEMKEYVLWLSYGACDHTQLAEGWGHSCLSSQI